MALAATYANRSLADVSLYFALLASHSEPPLPSVSLTPVPAALHPTQLPLRGPVLTEPVPHLPSVVLLLWDFPSSWWGLVAFI